MPERATTQRARRDKRQGKAPSTQAGEFVREEMDHSRRGKHGARSSKQVIAIGLSKARRAGLELKPPAAAGSSLAARRKAERHLELGHGETPARRTTAKRRRASTRALKREGTAAASRPALSAHAQAAARRRRRLRRTAIARQAAPTRAASGRSKGAKKPPRTRVAHSRPRGGSRELHA